jgi:TrpR-related protein YerC/YecD
MTHGLGAGFPTPGLTPPHKKGLANVLMRYYTIWMKKHALPKKPLKAGVESLAQAFNGLKNAEQIYAFLIDLCTPAELEALADRWQVVEPLTKGKPYRQIHDDTGVSVTTIGRVARCLELGTGGYQLALKGSRRGAGT